MSVHFKVKTTNDYKRGAAEPFQFPGGEWHLRKLPEVNDPSAVWIADVRGANLDELMQAALFADVAHQRQQPFVLMLPYLPAARSDRGEPAGARVYAESIKGMNPQQIIGIDPHSSYIVDYFNCILPGKLTALAPAGLLVRALTGQRKYDAVIAPDKGAIDRAATAAAALGIDCYHAEKHRVEATGEITSIKMTENLPASGSYLVVDDICDGGGTFLGLAEATGIPKEQLGLWVTHAIFSGNATTLRDRYQNIYTTDSHPGHNRVGCATTIVPCEVYMLTNLKEFS